MQIKYKINKSDYQKADQASLDKIAKNIADKTVDKPEYAAVKTEADAVKERRETYSDLLSKSQSGGSTVREEKDLAMQALIRALNALAAVVEINANGDKMYILNAGFKLQKERENYTNSVEAPYDIVVKSNGKPGEALLRMKIKVMNEVIAVAVEWSLDGKTNWTNAALQKGRLITVKGLPSRQEVFFRVRIFATRNRKSAWTEDAISTFIL